MIVRTTIFALGAGVVAAALGWTKPGLPPAPLVVTRGPQSARAQMLQRPDQTTLAASERLADFMGPAPGQTPVIDPDAPPPSARPAPPPEPDIAPIFRRQVTAVIDPGQGGLAVLLRDPSAAPGQSRILKVGDRFEGRWTLAGLTNDEAVLRRGGESRRVQLFETAGVGQKSVEQGRGIGDL